ncbi:hypothetical protein HT031_003426 [Scenedesmus sp. PABB004]|nr:hypothetical protein HT031_003426 [Scenedesmus sp. PABB004]
MGGCISGPGPPRQALLALLRTYYARRRVAAVLMDEHRTSITCSVCGARVEKLRGIYGLVQCPGCTVVAPRDDNAARNICALTLHELLRGGRGTAGGARLAGAFRQAAAAAVDPPAQPPARQALTRPEQRGVPAAMATEKKAPVFKNVADLRPGTHNHNLKVKVMKAQIVVDRPRGPKGTPLRVAECIVGDASGCIVFTARNEQVELATVGAYVTLRNAKIDMYRGSMRLAVDQWGKVEALEGASFEPKADNNLSLVEYELVTVPGETPAAS